MEIKIRGNHFVLLTRKAICWKEQQMLIVSDAHLGKITHFRKEGIAIPQSAIEKNFECLDELIAETQPHRILFLGDLFHHKYNNEWELFVDWRNKHQQLEVIIVIGNHDILPMRLYLDNHMKVFFDDHIIGDFLFTHHPKTVINTPKFIFAGHVHPVFTLQAKARQRLRLPCFVIDENQAILPSFGVFTGGFETAFIPNRRLFIVTNERVFEVSGKK